MQTEEPPLVQHKSHKDQVPQRQPSAHHQPKQGPADATRPPLHRFHKGRRQYSPEQQKERQESLPRYQSFSKQLAETIAENPKLYEQRCTQLLSCFQ